MFVELLIRYATTVTQTGSLKFTADSIWKGHSAEDCQRLVDRFFERGDRVLREFFVDARTFKQMVIGKVRAREEFVGKADAFIVLSPHEVVAIGSGYLKSISHVLKIGSDEKAQWFRRSGPIAADFDPGMVCPRQSLLTELKELVLSHHVSLLEGLSATGKTVLVRQMGYELSQKDGLAVYWFDRAVERSFDKDRLIREINSARGVFAIENVHLETPTFQRVYYSIDPDPRRHVLFTARSSFRESEEPRQRGGEVNRLAPQPVAGYEIVQHFAEHHADVRWPHKGARNYQERIPRELLASFPCA